MNDLTIGCTANHQQNFNNQTDIEFTNNNNNFT